MSIRLESVTKSYGDKTVLKDFSLALPDKGLAFLTGASGRGKTTLLRIISGLTRPDSGSVHASGRTAYAFQEDTLLEWQTVEQNVALVSDKTSAARWLKLLGLGSELKKRPSELSGGMRQRVNLARAFSYGGALLLLDEPYRGLDAELREALAGLIAQSAKERMVILVSHSEEEMLAAERAFGEKAIRIEL